METQELDIDYCSQLEDEMQPKVPSKHERSEFTEEPDTCDEQP